MTKNNERRLKIKDIKRRTALLLGERGNLLRMSGALLCSLAIVGTAIHLFESVSYFIFYEEFPIYMFIAEMILVLSLALPLCMGLSLMAYRMCRYERTEISDLFFYFDKKRIADAYKVSLAVLGGAMVQLALAFALGWLIAYALSGFGNDLIPDETYFLALMFFLFVSGMFPFIYILPNAFFKSENAKDSFSYSLKNNSLSPKEIICFNLSFMSIVLLSVLSFGILFIVYAMPLYLVSEQLFIIEKTQ